MAKKSRNYWSKRHRQWINNQDKMDAAASKKLKLKYKRISKDLENEIARYFKRYGKDDVIEFRTMLQDLDKSDKDLLFQDMEEFASKYPKQAHLMPIRESIYKLNRLQGLHYTTQLKLLELGVYEQDAIEKHLKKVYGKRYEQMLRELGIGNNFLAINNQLMIDTIYTKWINGENFSDRIWSNKDKLLSHLTTKYRDGLARGDNYAKLAKEIQERFDVGAFDAKRLVWSEASFVYGQAHSYAYINAGVEEYELDAIMDNETSKICRHMDGKTFRFDEMVVGLNYPPFHSFCRTTVTGKLDKI